MYPLDMYEESKNCSTACGRKQVLKLLSTIQCSLNFSNTGNPACTFLLTEC